MASAQFSPDGKQVLTASFDRTARIWDTRTGRQLAVFTHDESLLDAAYSPDGKRVATVPGDKTVRVWDVATRKQTMVLRGHQDLLETAAFSADGMRLVTAAGDRTARIWDVSEAKGTYVDLRGHEAAVYDAAFSPDGNTVITGSRDGTVRFWSPTTGQEIGRLDLEFGVTGVNFSPGGRRLVTASGDSAQIWDTNSRHRLETLKGHGAAVISAAFSRDGRYVVTGSLDNTARIWDASNGTTIRILQGHSNAVMGAKFNNDGTRVVTGSRDKTARIWDVATGKEIMILRGHEDELTSAEFSPDGRRIATASYDDTARIWDVDTGHAVWVLNGHQNSVVRAGFSADGRRVVTASYDKTARIWDVSNGQQSAVLRGHGERVWSAAFSPDGARVVTGSWDNTARIWEVPPADMTEELISQARQTAPRCLIQTERSIFFLDPEPPAWCIATGKWPYDAATLDVQGTQSYLEEKYDEGISAFDRAIALDPNFAAAYLHRGKAYADKNDYHHAIEDYDRAIALDPGYAEAYYYRGRTYQEKKEYDLALADYRQALALMSIIVDRHKSNSVLRRDLSSYHIRIGDVLIQIDRLQEALVAFHDALNIRKALVERDKARWQDDLQISIDRIAGLSYRFALAGNFAMTLQIADEAIALAPDQTWYYTNRAHALMFLDRVDEARAIYLRHRGDKKVQGEKSWETVVLEDFAELRKAGRSHPLMDEIERRFAAAG
jgi:WD40 repeat protein/tetratricopeptide (TPR) repeat protein